MEGKPLKQKALIACVSIVLSLGVNGTVQGADESVSPSNPVVAPNSPTEKELGLFFEEQDLVTANKRPTSLRKAPAIATIITADEIRNMGANSILDVLKMVPGIGISITESGVMMLEVRGIRTSINEKVLVMIDGHSLNKNFDGSALYNVAGLLPVENIKQVEVVRGPGSALYGTSAFVATINIITRNAEEINGLELKSGWGSFDTFKANMVAGKALGDKLTFSMSADHYQTNGPNLRIPADVLTPSGTSLAPGPADSSTKQTDIFFKVGYGDLSFRGHYLTKKRGLFIGLGSALTESSQDMIDNYWGELAYDLHITKGLTSNTKLRYDYYDQDPYARILPIGALGVYTNGMVAIPMVKNRNIGVEEQLSWDIHDGHHLILGASFDVMRQYGTRQLTNFDPSTFAPLVTPVLQETANWNKDVTREAWALYGQYEWRALENLNITLGGRYDHYNDFGGTTNPRVAVVWNFLENADLKLLYGKAFRAPNFVELYNINNPVIVGNPNLKPEKIETYEAGLAYRFNRFFAAELNYFYSDISNMIILNTNVPPNAAAYYDNIGKAIIQGFEFGVNGAYKRDFYWKLSYAWQEPRDGTTNKPLPYVPAQRAKAGLNYALTKYVNLHTDLLWTGVRPRDTGDTRQQMPAYFTADMAMTFKNFYKTLEIQAVVKNLLNQQYRDPDTSSANKVPFDFPREGISGFVTASYKF
jgi:outer membrane cobalamin receptor